MWHDPDFAYFLCNLTFNTLDLSSEIFFPCFNLMLYNFQASKNGFVEHRTFLHLYRSFHRLWIFLVMMFQVDFSKFGNKPANCCIVFYCFILDFYMTVLLHLQLQAKPCALMVVQGLTIVGFNNGKATTNTFKQLLSLGPTYAVMNFIECMAFSFLKFKIKISCCNHTSGSCVTLSMSFFDSSSDLSILFPFPGSLTRVLLLIFRLLGRDAHVWSIYNFQRPCYCKALC